MLEYIYFVKCPGRDDEHFDFFNDAKDFAIGCLSLKPIITQIEVDRNDFGECTNSADLGTVWSWEDMMRDIPSEAPQTVFSKADTLECTCNGSCSGACSCGRHNSDFMNDDLFEEFTVGSKVFCKPNKKTGVVKKVNGDHVEVEFTGGEEPDRIDTYYKQDLKLTESHKPVPADMTADDIVEAMEENEDTVECKWCDELFDKSECRYEVDLGWLCNRCQSAIMSRGEELMFRDGYLMESFDPNTKVEFNYTNLRVTLQGPKRDVDDWDEETKTVSYDFEKRKEDVATDIWENFIQEVDAKDVEGGLEALEDDTAWHEFLSTHFDTLLDKYYKELLDYYRDDACAEYEENHGLEENCKTRVGFLEELEEADDYSEHLVDCPECGAEQSFDHETGICINCGFNI